ncbi:hypothetical protein Bca101_045856 [Brassica carinata]
MLFFLEGHMELSSTGRGLNTRFGSVQVEHRHTHVVLHRVQVLVTQTNLVLGFLLSTLALLLFLLPPFLVLQDLIKGLISTKRQHLSIIASQERDVKNKWEKSSWGGKLIVQKRRASLNDFDRFKIMLSKIKESWCVGQELAKLKKDITA